MDNGFEIERLGEIRQARQFPRALLRDFRLSFGARGLFAFLWDLPTGWRIRATHLALCGPQKRDAIRSALRELVAVGAIRVELVRGEKGRLAGKKWILLSPHLWAIESSLSRATVSEPLTEKDPTEGREIRPSASPTFGNADAKVITDARFSSSFDVVNGIAVWNDADREAAKQLLAKFGEEKVAAAVDFLSSKNKDPLPGRIRHHLVKIERSEMNRAKAAATSSTNAPAPFKADPKAQENGQKILDRVRSKLKSI